MITTNIEWHETAAELPEKSGYYLIHSYYITEVRYSSEHKLFNTFDGQTEESAKASAIYPNYWADVPELPEKKLEEKQWQI